MKGTVDRSREKRPNKKLRQEREKRFWTLEDVANRINLLPEFGPGQPDPHTVGRWERGIAGPSPRYRRALCTVFEADACTLGLVPPAEEPREDIVSETVFQKGSGQGNTQEKESSQVPVTPQVVELQVQAESKSIAQSFIAASPLKHIYALPIYKRFFFLSIPPAILILLLVGIMGQTRTNPQELYREITTSRPVFLDPLYFQTMNQWDEEEHSMGSCSFVEDAYQVVARHAQIAYLCQENIRTFCNMAIQVQMTLLQGDGGGVILRSNQGKMYRFRVGADGTYDFVDQTGIEIVTGTASFIRQGIQQKNLLTVIARNDHFFLYVNGHHLSTVVHQGSSCGYVGFLAVDFSQTTRVLFQDVRVWEV